MIKIAGSAHRSFVFPADLATTFEYFRDIPRLVSYLPHITYVGRTDSGDFRVRYRTKELGSYEFAIFCDLRVDLNHAAPALCIQPIDSLPPIHPEVSRSRTTARGYFACQVTFEVDGIDEELTQVAYGLELQAKVPTPHGLRRMPGLVVSRIAKRITNGRIKEIADGFNKNVVAGYEAQFFAKDEA